MNAETTTLEAKLEAQPEHRFVPPLSVSRDERRIEGRTNRASGTWPAKDGSSQQ